MTLIGKKVNSISRNPYYEGSSTTGHTLQPLTGVDVCRNPYYEGSSTTGNVNFRIKKN